MRKLLIIAALLMLAVPARADTILVIVDITVNPFNAPDGNATLDLLHEFAPPPDFDPFSVQLVETFGPGITPSFSDPDPYSYIITSVSLVPEPATWAMMLLGFAGLGFAFRQRRLFCVASAAINRND